MYAVHKDLYRRASLAEIHKIAPAPMQPEREIALDQVTYHYPKATQPAVVDVILGLRRPTEGAVVINGEQLTDENLCAWQADLGYVPQDIFSHRGQGY